MTEQTNIAQAELHISNPIQAEAGANQVAQIIEGSDTSSAAKVDLLVSMPTDKQPNIGQSATVIESDGATSPAVEASTAETKEAPSEKPKSVQEEFKERMSAAEAKVKTKVLLEMGGGKVPLKLEAMSGEPDLQAEYLEKYAESMKAEKANIMRTMSLKDYAKNNPMPENANDQVAMDAWHKGAEEHNEMFDKAINEVPSVEKLKSDDNDADEKEKTSMTYAFKLAFKYLGAKDEGKKTIEQEVEKINKNHPDFKGKFNTAHIILVGAGMATMAAVGFATAEASKAVAK